MRNRTLHSLLAAFAQDAAAELSAELAAGAEIPFEVIEEPGARRPLYCYRPLTGAFIRERVESLERSESYLPALRAVAALDGAEHYLRHRGEPRVPSDARERADAVLRSFVQSVFGEATDFAHRPDEFERTYAELEAAVYEGRRVRTVIAQVLGLGLAGSELPLGDGLTLVQGDQLEDAPSQAVWSGEAGQPVVLAVLELEEERDGGPAIALARLRLHRLLTALRLFDAGNVALGPIAWERSDAGPWQLLALGGGGRPRGRLEVAAEQEDELRAFCNLVARRAPARGSGGGELAWALARFEMGCERLAPYETLTDHLLALRALLEPEGPASGRLAQRLAVICAPPAGRAALAERLARAVELERATISGLAAPYGDADGLADDVTGCLRAILRDVICGHLDADVGRVADELLAEAAEAVTVG